jgi:hypothetical protein
VHSYSFRDVDADRLVVTAGTATYDTVNVPSDSGSRTSVGGAGLAFYAPWHDDPNAAFFEPSGEELWYHARYYTDTHTGGAGLRLGVARGGVEYVSVSSDADGHPTIRIAGTVRATSTETWTLSAWNRVHVRLTGTAAGDQVRVYLDGDLSEPVLTHILSSADATALAGVGTPNGFLCATKASAAERIDDCVAWDPEDAGFPGIHYFSLACITDIPFTGAGAEAGMTGTYAAIDEVPPDGADALVATAVGQESTFTKDPLAEANVFAAVLRARVERTGTDAGSSITLLARSGADVVQATMSAPINGAVQYAFETAPDGEVLTPASFDPTRYGFASAT